ncbi:MAG: AbgT family transporter [Gammaproteobacteria bacterium]
MPADANARRLVRLLDAIERAGNRLPDPAMLFLLLLGAVALLSAGLSAATFAELDPRTGQPLVIHNLLAPDSLTAFMAGMVRNFVEFPPLGVVLVAMLGIGVAEHSGYIAAALRALLSITSRHLLTPAVIAVGIVSHVAVDAGYVLVIPLGGLAFHAAGRHPLAGIAAAFAGVSGGFSANVVPSSLDPMLSGLTEAAARIVDPSLSVNPLNNWFFTLSSSVLIVAVGWLVTERVIEPRLAANPVDTDGADLPPPETIDPRQRRALMAATLALLAGCGLLALSVLPAHSAWRNAAGMLTAADAPLMRSIVALIFVLFVIPGIVYGRAAGTMASHRDVIAGMSKAMGGMGYYLVMAFFAAQFIAAFGQSNLGALVAIKGAAALRDAGMPMQATLIGIVLLTAGINLLIGSASAKWALLAPVFVPMLMQLGISPDLTQAAYRVGDSSTNIITPLLPYFPLIVVYCRRYVRSTGIGTVVALMLPYSIAFLAAWSIWLIAFWSLGLPLGLQASYVHPPLP